MALPIRPADPRDSNDPRPVRVFLVDDSPVALLLLQRLLAGDAGILVVGTARNGLEAMALLKTAQPDVIVTDYHMPVMNGLDLVRAVMERFPRPILVVSSTVGESQEEGFAMLQAGAVDVFPKPQGLGSIPEAAAQLRQKIHLLAGVVVISRPAASAAPVSHIGAPSTCTPASDSRGDSGAGASARSNRERGRDGGRDGGAASTCGADVAAPGAARTPVQAPPPEPVHEGRAISARAISRHEGGARVVAIGASTGGPQTLQAILGALGPGFGCPILCVQHISHGFLDGLVEWLGRSCHLRVQVAGHGEEPRAGTVYFAPQDRHLELDSRGRMAYSSAPPVDGHRPSASALFSSVARSAGPHAVGVLLTGMGADGASGLLEMARAGAATIAQDEASSVIFGMPRQAIALGAARYVLPQSEVALALERLTARA